MTQSNKDPLSASEIAAVLHRAGCPCSPLQASQIKIYIELLLKWNQVVSLTSVREPRQVLSRHFVETFLGGKFAQIDRGRLADVGSGAGFPGLALKVMSPLLQVTLIEPNSRKCAFLKEVVRALAFTGVQVHQGRIESSPFAGAAFDFASCRAVGKLDRVVDCARAALRPGGKLALWIGSRDAEALNRLPGWVWKLSDQLQGSRERVVLVGTLKTD
jgi:16S rRNA (guanine527-N7)-methyltransferase